MKLKNYDQVSSCLPACIYILTVFTIGSSFTFSNPSLDVSILSSKVSIEASVASAVLGERFLKKFGYLILNILLLVFCCSLCSSVISVNMLLNFY